MWKRLFSPTPKAAPELEAVPVVLYTRRDCPLCDEMKAELKRSRPAQRYALREVDIEGDPELERLHGLSIPVLAIAGRAAFKGRMTAADFERKLARRAAERRAERTG